MCSENESGRDCMTGVHIYLTYMMAWVVYQLWSIHKWMRKDEEKVTVTAESVGTELHDILNYVSGETIANVALMGFMFLSAIDVFGILLVKGYIQEPEWISCVLMGLVCVTVIQGVHMAVAIYRVVLREVKSCKPDAFFVRYERLYEKGVLILRS